jgi:hypothetical protein
MYTRYNAAPVPCITVIMNNKVLHTNSQFFTAVFPVHDKNAQKS